VPAPCADPPPLRRNCSIALGKSLLRPGFIVYMAEMDELRWDW
jgi:hypothetical protein